MRLIDADELWMNIIRSMDYCDDILEIIERQPTIEPERKTGKWIWVECVDVEGLGTSAWKCSECDEIYRDADNYCPNCGAKMEGEER